MMALTKRPPCYCSGVGAVAIAVLTLLVVRGVITGAWASWVVIVLAVLIAIGSLTGLCCECASKCKTEQKDSE